MVLIAYRKRFLQLTTGVPGRTHDAQLLRYSTLFKDIQSEGGLPSKSKILGDFGEMPLVAIADAAFPHLKWFLGDFGEMPLVAIADAAFPHLKWFLKCFN